jgi:hypothetical protein
VGFSLRLAAALVSGQVPVVMEVQALL